MTGPALYPLFHDTGWFLEGSVEKTLNEIRAVLLRTVASLPLKHLCIDVYDPSIGGKLGGFSPLRSAHSAAFPVPRTSASQFKNVLESVTDTASRNAEAIATAGARHLGELWSRRGVPEGVYRLLVVLNYPEGIDAELQRTLVRLARSGGPNGITLLVQHDSTRQAQSQEVATSELSRSLRKSGYDSMGNLLLADYPNHIPVTPDLAPPAELLEQVISDAAEEAAKDTGPIVPLEELITEQAHGTWTEESTTALGTAIARIGHHPVSIEFRSSNPPIANALVGGAVGQGKSNLLLTILYGLASRYSPEELELHLLDFKQGLEFQRFGPDAQGLNWLPHAKVLSLESDRDFGLAVLRYISAELQRRARVMKSVGANDLAGFRVASGQKMPRLLLVIDEFQVLFDGEDSLVDEAVSLLESIARQGRAYGVHLLLSSQTTAGVAGLRVKGESIFSQFALRIALKTTANNSEDVLGQGNKAAAGLTYRGEVIINRNFGQDPEGSNVRAVSAYAEPDYIDELQKELWNKAPDGEAPMVFIPTDFARWPETLPAPDPDGTVRGIVGMPLRVDKTPVELELTEDIDQAIAVVGSDPSIALPVLSSLVRSLVSSAGIRRIVIVDLSAKTAERAGEPLFAVLRMLEVTGVTIKRYGRVEAQEAMLNEITSALDQESGPQLVLGIGWQRWIDLDASHPLNPEDDLDFSSISMREVLEKLAQRGALVGVHLLAWWSTLSSLSNQLGYDYRGVRHLITAKLNLEDYRSVTSPTQPPLQGYPRAAHVDRSGDAGPSAVIPFHLPEEAP
ncbi:FtsK/SpoIIIE domain-containing protein [Nesterenkonia muleiensis]|uniref:FtsK/SpoIIIE domain-containing protein n=1 Tax=Nesterenkonia muleiensis TaxID=2282648 RepID=UPI001300341F|nr:FtsK/SpoIIIE domain-containing protein [Nesterenkonia muleiensis]